MYTPILGSLLEASAMIIEKKILKKHKINFQNYTVYGFLAIIIVMIPFVYFFWQVDAEAMKIKNLLILLAIIITALLANLLTYYSLKREDISELEPIRLLLPLLTILLAFIFSFFFKAFYNEREYSILILGIIASLALIIPHLKKHHLNFNKYISAALLGNLFFALELVFSKFIIEYYSSFTFYFIRCVFIFLIAWIIFQPKLNSIENKIKIRMLFVSILWIFYRIIMYYGYETYGIILTTIMMSVLTPVFIFIFAAIFLKEKINIKYIISSIIIILCVVASIFLKV